MARFPYEYGMQANLSEIYCPTTHRESLVSNVCLSHIQQWIIG